MNDFKEELAGSGIKDEDCSINGLGSQIAFERFVDCNPIHVSVINEQLDLVAEQLRVVLRVQELLVTLGSVQL